MNILRRILGGATDPLEARLQRLVRRPETVPAWLRTVTKQIHHPGVELFRDAGGVIRHVRIGPRRIIAASKSRHITEVRDLACERVVVRIDREDAAHGIPRSTTWELYDLEGHLLAMLQSVPEKNVWMATDFESPTVSQQNSESRVPKPIFHPSASAAGGSLGLGLLPCSG